jgi:hypothetical protein
MIFAAVSVTVKAESIKKCPIETLIEAFIRVIGDASAEEKALFGPSSDLDPSMSSQSLDFQTFFGEAKYSEIPFLIGIDWQFLIEYPFSTFNHWIRPMRDLDDIEDFRRMRAIAVHNLILFLVVTEGPTPPYEVVAAAAITDALSRVPMKKWSADHWADAISARFDREAARKAGRLIPELDERLAGTSLASEDP